MRLLGTATAAIATLAFLTGSSNAAEPTADFARDIQPLFTRLCVECHGPAKQRVGLRLDSPDGVREGGNSGPVIVPGKSAESRLVHALTGTNDLKLMPPKEPRLSRAEIARVTAWIDQGAKFPTEKATAAKSTHWSFRPVRPIVPPVVKQSEWPRNPIDAFVLARLETEKIAPSSEADKITLLRRVSLDLTGLPPTPDEVDDFLKDSSADAYKRVVERLLRSPHFGERWGRHWLDLARYADSNGYSIDAPRTIWPYRDWVINALNRDLPFDRFTIEQLAGDLLPGATSEQRVATGFHRNTQINEEGGIDPEQFRVVAVVDRVNTTGAVWLGLTVSCCQCHNHKFDPLSQKEYYQFFAFFNNQDEPTLPLGPPPKADPPAKGKKGPQGLTTMVLQERATLRDTHVHIGGDFTRRGVKVAPGMPSGLPSMAAKRQAADRLDLAKWLVSADNPLTARVTVNRIWGVYFGTGIVETENDFGTQGTPPSHPELLDWLAAEFIRRDWSLKDLHRLIVTSATYRQSSDARPDLETIDPRNRLLARQVRLRLEAEGVRDVCLAAAGLLDHRVGGPSVFPPQPEGVFRFTQVSRTWAPSEGPDRYRRGMYTYFWRAAPHPALMSFDAPDAGTTCTRRNRSNTPLQALTLLNDAGFTEYAAGLAARILRDGEASESAQVDRAFRLAFGREATDAERERLIAFLSKQRAHYATHPDEVSPLLEGAGPAGKALAKQDGPAADKAALVLLARVVLNLDECITRE